MAGFGGWDMPIQYSGILAEHQCTRTQASLFDICHMGELEFGGATAAADLDRLVSSDIGTLAIGQARYGYLLNDDGGVIDDVICFRLAEELFWMVVNAGTRATDVDWIREHLSVETMFQDVSDRTGKLDIQGPRARAHLEAALGHSLPDLGYFRFTELDLLGHTCLLSRTGYTGEFGYELYCPSEHVESFWDAILSVEQVEPAGLGARDTLRLEMGYPLYGHELSAGRNVAEACRGMFLSKSKLAERTFCGANAVADALDKGCSQYLCALTLEGRQAARADDRVTLDGRDVGIITSGAFAPSLGHAVALAYVDAELSNTGTSLTLVNQRGKELTAVVSDLPFYKDGTARTGTGI